VARSDNATEPSPRRIVERAARAREAGGEELRVWSSSDQGLAALTCSVPL
jgi:hypothetical protein